MGQGQNEGMKRTLLFVLDVSGWWVAASALVAWYLVKVARDGQCQGIQVGAEEDEAFYRHLAESGAFLFTPDDLDTEPTL